jgi:hypothetical protein
MVDSVQVATIMYTIWVDFYILNTITNVDVEWHPDLLGIFSIHQYTCTLHVQLCVTGPVKCSSETLQKKYFFSITEIRPLMIVTYWICAQNVYVHLIYSIHGSLPMDHSRWTHNTCRYQCVSTFILLCLFSKLTNQQRLPGHFLQLMSHHHEENYPKKTSSLKEP